MAQALVTAVLFSLVGLITTAILGLRGGDVTRHISYGFFPALVGLLAHSMMMFYLIGKGKAVKDAMAEHGVAGDYYRRVAKARKPVFSIGTLAMAVTMAAAILGASVDTGVLPPIVHAMIAYGAIACNVAALKIEVDALGASGRVVDELNQVIVSGGQSGSVTAAVLEIAGLSLDYGALRPLRLQQLSLAPAESVALVGLDQAAAEVLVNLVTGATLPNAGTVHVFGRATSAIAGADDWLAFVDRFGIVSARAVLLDELTVIQNLAMPFTLEIEPPSDDARGNAAALAEETGLIASQMDGRVGDLDAAGRLRVRLGRALALRPSILLLEHATAGLSATEAQAAGRLIRSIAARRGAAILTATADETFARSVADRVLALEPSTGRLRERGLRSWFRG